MIRVLVVDDHKMFAESLTRLLGDEPDIEVCATAFTSAEAEALVAEHTPDVCVLDYQLPDADGAHTAVRLRGIDADLRIVMLTGLGRPSTARDALSAGCGAFVTKDRAAQDLVESVRDVFEGVHSIHDDIDAAARTRRASAAARGLTAREFEVLQLLADGASSDEIAEQLFVARNTVRTHVQRVIAKMGAHSKLEAVAAARAEYLV